MYSQNLTVGFQRLFFFAQLLQNHRQTGNCPEMSRIECQRTRDIIDRRTKQPGLLICRGARIPAFGKFRRVICQRRQVLDRSIKVTNLHRGATSFQQQIHRCRPRARPFGPDFLFDLFPAALIRLSKFNKQLIQNLAIVGLCRQRHSVKNCYDYRRNDCFEDAG